MWLRGTRKRERALGRKSQVLSSWQGHARCIPAGNPNRFTLLAGCFFFPLIQQFDRSAGQPKILRVGTQ